MDVKPKLIPGFGKPAPSGEASGAGPLLWAVGHVGSPAPSGEASGAGPLLWAAGHVGSVLTLPGRVLLWLLPSLAFVLRKSVKVLVSSF